MRLAEAALKNAEFEVAGEPGYALRSSRPVITVTCCLTFSSELKLGGSLSSVLPCGVHSFGLKPIGM